MSLSDELRARAKALAADAQEAAARLDAEAADAAIAKARAWLILADRVERDPAWAARVLAESVGLEPVNEQKALPAVNEKATVSGVIFSAEHRANMSKARAPRSKIAAHLHKLEPPMTMTELCAKIGLSKSQLSQAGSGVSPMPEWAADKIQALTGYSKRNWKRLS